jgi:sec-independent protein translocase protein TatA
MGLGLENPLHIAFLLLIILLVFGAKRLPGIGRSLGGGMREFKDAITARSPEPPTDAAEQRPQTHEAALAPAVHFDPPPAVITDGRQPAGSQPQ